MGQVDVGGRNGGRLTCRVLQAYLSGTMATKKKAQAVPRGGAGAAPTEDYYKQLGLFPLRVRVSKETLAMLDGLVPLASKATKAQAVEEAIALAHKMRVKR